MRLTTGYPRIALFGVASITALFAVTTQSIGAATRTPAAGPSTDELVVIASAGTDRHDHGPVPVPSVLLAAAAEPVVRAAPVVPVIASALLPVVGTQADGPRSVAVDYGDRTKKRVSLTFDAGADAGFAENILDTLARDHVIASFGMTGTWAEQNPALVKRMAAEGHQLINHTWSHGSFTGFSTNGVPATRAQRWDELDRTEAAIQRIAGVSMLPYFRPPYGDMDASVLADVGARGYTVTAMWAVDSLGWNGLSAPRIVERTLRLTSPGAVLIFHVGSQSQDAAALPAIIRGLRDNGYDFVSVATLVGN